VAASELVNFNAAESHINRRVVISSLICARSATLPSNTASVSGPAQSKFDPPGFPPFGRRDPFLVVPNRTLKFFGGSPYSFARDSGNNR
jgi:hypothetical protein